MLKKACDAQPADAAAVRAKTQELWEGTLELVRDNATAMSQANLKMMEVWAGLLRVGAQAGNTKK
jgi:hypothetical protein